jgi:hypothetical protein
MHFFDLVGPLEPATEDPNGGSQKLGKLEYAKDHLAVEVSTNHVDLLLLVCCLVTGFIDSTVYSGMTLPNTTSGFADFSSIRYLCVYANRFESSANKRLQTALSRLRPVLTQRQEILSLLLLEHLCQALLYSTGQKPSRQSAFLPLDL